MVLNGGVLIIGSLIWQDHLNDKKKDNIRRDWRRQHLAKGQLHCQAPIRYGRRSSTRKDTYTMIFSASCESQPGQAIIKPFIQPLQSFEHLEEQAIALAIAEGVYKETSRRLSAAWGSVGLLFNPALEKKSRAVYSMVRDKWAAIYHAYHDTFFPDGYKLAGDALPPIDKNGLLQISWRTLMDDFDLLLATPVVPDPLTPLTPVEIAGKMNEKNYYEYFDKNREEGITTFQDDAITGLIQRPQ